MSNPKGLKIIDKVEEKELNNKPIDKSEEKKKPSYIFPNFLGSFMSKVDMRTQLEASMLSMTLMMFGLIITVIYIFIYTDFQLWYKIFLILNGLAGVTFMSSFVITTFQQYRSYMEITEYQKEQKGEGEEIEKMEKNIEEYYCSIHGVNGGPTCQECIDNLNKLAEDNNARVVRP